MYVCTCKIIAQGVTKQIQNKKKFNVAYESMGINQVNTFFSTISFACLKSFGFLNF